LWISIAYKNHFSKMKVSLEKLEKLEACLLFDDPEQVSACFPQIDVLANTFLHLICCT
jgi:hypothetical protein